MQDVPSPVKTVSLRVRLIRGEIPGSATVEELSEVLGMSPGGEIDPVRREKAHKALLRHLKDNLIEAKDTGLARPVINTFHIHTVSPDTIPKKWPVFQVKVYSLDAIQLSKVKHLLHADGLWSMWGDKFCNSSSEVLPSASEQASIANTAIPFQKFKQRFSPPKWKGDSTLDNIYKNRKRKDAPYAAAFNDDGTVNEPKFVGIARARGDIAADWKDGENADSRESNVDDVINGWGRPKR